MTARATACPNCGTAFRVGTEQLEAANGLVRCGACQAVFDARAHAVGPVLAPAAEPALGIDEDYIAGLILGEAPIAAPADAVGQMPAAANAPDTDTATEDRSAAAAPAAAAAAAAAAAESVALMPRVPVELPTVAEPDLATRRRILAWSSGIAVAALLIGMQQIWLGRERHAQDPELRPRYERLCAVLGCELPPFRDLRRIRSEGLLVRADPARPGTLLIDATIVNKAPFAQAFPGIRIDFSDIQGTPVTSRAFSPREYLGAAALREGSMPPGEVLKVHIEMPDPGEDATNYELQLTDPVAP